MTETPHYLSHEELLEWRRRIEEANYNSVLCHCRKCHRKWIASQPEACLSGSRNIEHIACWQFPDD